MSSPVPTPSGSGLSDRLGDGMGPLVAGVMMLPVAAAVLLWNELGAIERHRTLHEGVTRHVSSTGERVDPADEGKLIHLVARAETDEVLVDEAFFVRVAGALRLSRNVEMYQWIERPTDREELPLAGAEDGETATYDAEWSAQLIDSSGFRSPEVHANPDSFPYESKDWTARQARLGAYRMTPDMIERIGGSERIDHGEEVAAADGDQEQPVSSIAVTPAGLLFLGAGTPEEPEIGDIRVEHRVVRPQTVTIVAEQDGDSLGVYTTDTGGELFYVMTGEKSADQVFKQAEQGNRLLTWLMRAGGVLLMFIGFGTMMRPMLLLARSTPLAWRVVGDLSGSAALLLSVACAALVVGLVWIFYLPLPGLLFLLLGAALMVLADRIGLGNRASMVRTLIRRERMDAGPAD